MAAGRYLPGLRALRRLGGQVVPSFGGYSADHALTEIADSCTNMHKLVAAYESVVRTYGATRLDMDVEDRSLENLAGIDRRNKALRRVEAWAARTGRRLQIAYTLPVEPPGLESDGLHVLRNAIRNGTRVDVVNIMTFDYYDGVTTDMGAAAISAARGLHGQLHVLYPHRSSRRLWAMEGNTIMPGIDDYPRKTEVTTLADAAPPAAVRARRSASAPSRCGRSSATTATARAGSAPTRARGSSSPTGRSATCSSRSRGDERRGLARRRGGARPHRHALAHARARAAPRRPLLPHGRGDRAARRRARLARRHPRASRPTGARSRPSYDATVDWPACAFWARARRREPRRDRRCCRCARAPRRGGRASRRPSPPAWPSPCPPTSPTGRCGARWWSSMLDVTFTPDWREREAAIAAYEAHNAAVRAAVPRDRLVEWQPGRRLGAAVRGARRARSPPSRSRARTRPRSSGPASTPRTRQSRPALRPRRP